MFPDKKKSLSSSGLQNFNGKWTSSHPQLNGLKAFGCTTYAHVKQGKLDARALKCIFLGYPDEVKGYKIWCIEPGSQNIIVNRDVTFKEDEFPLKTHTDE